MENDDRPSSKTELTLAERLRRAALEAMDGLEILKIIKEIEDEIRDGAFESLGRDSRALLLGPSSTYHDVRLRAVVERAADIGNYEYTP